MTIGTFITLALSAMPIATRRINAALFTTDTLYNRDALDVGTAAGNPVHRICRCRRGRALASQPPKPERRHKTSHELSG